MTGRRAGMSAVAATALVVGMMLVLVMFAARTGPQRIIHGTLVDPRFGHVVVGTDLGPLHQLGSAPAQGTFHRRPSLSWAGWIVRAGIYVLLGWLAYRGLRLLRVTVRDRERPEPRPAAVDFDVLDDPGELVDEMRDDAAGQTALLRDGSPRNAIVACWGRFEEQARRAGLARRPWETSSEFTLRLLDLVGADGGAVTRLERLYHEARFSQHEIDEDRRAAAVAALESIHGSLRSHTTAGR